MTDLLVRRRELDLIGTPDSSIRRSLRRGALVRVAAGAYADAAEWSTLDGMMRHRMRVLANADRVRSDVVFSHFAAAALWGIRLLGKWPTLVDVTLDRASGGRSDGALRRHCTGLDGVEIASINGLSVTSPAQTVVDLGRVLPFADAVVVIDGALHNRHRAPLATIESVRSFVSAAAGKRGCRRAAAAANFATPLSDSVEESHSRVWIHRLGFPAPVLQKSFGLSRGRKAEVDFFWEQFEHVGECDGFTKYSDPKILQGRTPHEVLRAEKERENEVRRHVRMFSRWEPAELYPARRLYDRLTRDGLPSSGRRP